MHATCACVLVLSTASVGAGQPSENPQPRLTLAALVATSGADATTIECCELRAPPRVEALDESTRVMLVGVDVRFFWAPRTATFVELERSGTDTRRFTFPRPPSVPLPFDFYEAERTVSYGSATWTFGQTAELMTEGRVRPWIFGGLALRRTRERQTDQDVGFLDPSARAEHRYEWHRRQWAFVTGAGARAYLTRRLFLSGELGWAFYGRQVCTDCARPRSGPAVEPKFSDYAVLRAAAGVSF